MFQISVMFVGLFIIVIKGSIDVNGGFPEVWSRAEKTQRLEFFE